MSTADVRRQDRVSAHRANMLEITEGAYTKGHTRWSLFSNKLLDGHQHMVMYDDMHSTRHSVFKIRTVLSPGVSRGSETKSVVW